MCSNRILGTFDCEIECVPFALVRSADATEAWNSVMCASAGAFLRDPLWEKRGACWCTICCRLSLKCFQSWMVAASYKPIYVNYIQITTMKSLVPKIQKTGTGVFGAERPGMHFMRPMTRSVSPVFTRFVWALEVWAPRKGGGGKGAAETGEPSCVPGGG